VLQLAASAWVDDDVAAAVAELLRRAVPLVAARARPFPVM
jgi:hypothetical protein